MELTLKLGLAAIKQIAPFWQALMEATSNFEEISEFYESIEGVNYADNARDFGSVEKKILNDVECASLLEENFSTQDELLDRIRNMALKEGYVTTIKKSKPGCYVIIGCDRGGKYRGTSVPLSEGTRMSGSCLVNCPSQILGKKKDEKFVKAWTGNHLLLGNCVTSRAEGAYAMLMRYLTVSTRNFHEELVTHVSIFALSELLKQYELSTSSLLDPCRSQFSNTMGLPCAHFMQNMRGEPLLLSDIHPQWRIDIRSFNIDGGVNTNGSDIESLLKKFHDKYKCMPLGQRKDSHKQIAQLIDAEIPLTLEPTIQPHKGRPSGSKKRKGDSSTTRDPSAFEIAEKTGKCSVCHHVGHNRSTCQRLKSLVDRGVLTRSVTKILRKLFIRQACAIMPKDIQLARRIRGEHA
ncbi:hypothetical protein RHSIM_RhsimUnG0244500 [Rhododendron simsii]|uniref:Protein FAR1-RELATED SEQUENCE n=1 Tax=Rhododendron simsii TaxID=118357 RepID=A0A834L3A4_RHOSS|nr:hypothetical protein RHSIM_RhsimUnG0244500 [Rhododendron simsii]